MFQRTTQNKDELIQSAAADYRAASARHAEIQSERTALLAAPLATKEQVSIMTRVLDRSRERFEGEFDRRLAVMNEPHFDLNDRACLDAIDPIRIMGSSPPMAWADAVGAMFAPAILAYVEIRAKANGGDRSKLTLAKKQAELARLDTLIIQFESASQRALNIWREQTGNLTGYP